MPSDSPNDWDQKDLDAVEPEDPPGALPEGFGKSPLLSGGIAVVLLAALATLSYFFFRSEPEAPEPPVEVETPLSAEPAPPEEPLEEALPPLPSLDQSDALLREWIAKMLTHPELAKWLLTEGLARRLVASVDAIADGVSPARQLGFLRPEAKFRVTRRGGKVFVDPESYRRYDAVAEGFSAIEVATAAKAYGHVRPLLEEAYAELGRDRDFGQALALAIDRTLATPQITGEVELKEKIKSFAYVDPELEALDPAQKQFLRLGPENLSRIQAKLRALKTALP